MDFRRSHALRIGIRLLPIIAVAVFATSAHSIFKTKGTYQGRAEAAHPGQELVWQCRTSFTPKTAVLDTPHFAIEVPSTRTTQHTGNGVVDFTVSTPQKIKSYLSTEGTGFDVCYSRGVCTISLGPQEFQIINTNSLLIGGKTVPLTGPKFFIKVARGGRFTVDGAEPGWYSTAFRKGFQPHENQVSEKWQDVHPIIPSSADTLWPGRALAGPNIAAIDCERFAVAVQTNGPPTHTTGDEPSVVHLDIKVAGPNNLTSVANAVQEQYSQGIAAFTIGGVNVNLVERGARLQTPSQSIALSGGKKYVTVAPNGTVSVATRKPKWFAAFDHAPANPPHMTYTIAAE